MLELLKTSRKAQIITGLVVVLILGIILVLIFNRRPPNSPVVPDNVRVDLVWQIPKGTQSYYAKSISNFNQLPGNNLVNIEVIEKDLDENYYRNLIIDFAKETGPDIFSFNGQDFPAVKEWLTPITGIPGVTDASLLADYKTNFTDLVVRDTTSLDKIYAVTSYVDTIQLYYNKNLLEQASIALPPAKWDDLQRQLNSLNKINVDKTFNQSAISLGTGFVGPGKDIQTDVNIANFQDVLPLLIFQTGGQLYDFNTQSNTFGADKNASDVANKNITSTNFGGQFKTDNPTYSALQFYLSFADQQSNRYSWSTTNKNNVDSFLEGKLAYILGYSSFQKEIETRQNRIRYGVSEVPQLTENNKRTFGKYIANGASRKLELDVENFSSDPVKVKKLQKARELLYYLTSSESQLDFFAKSNLPAARKDIINIQKEGDEKIRIFANGSLYADNYYKPNNKLNNQMWGNLIYRIQFENKTIDESLSTAISEYALTVTKGAQLDF